ncbi:MAG: hypothetical protein ABI885_03210 [Gammaproteobacteria bacterium]
MIAVILADFSVGDLLIGAVGVERVRAATKPPEGMPSDWFDERRAVCKILPAPSG